MTRGYAEGVAQSAFGNQTSQSYGGEIGLTISPALQIFVEGGRVRNVAPETLATNAQAIATALGSVQPGTVTFVAKEPTTFGTAGLKYVFPLSNTKAQLYALGGFGAARVTQDVHFLIGGTDITSNITQFGIVLGSDLSGDLTKAMMTIGGGVVWPVWEHVIVDFQYRYGRIFVPDQGINLNRAGLGIGVQF
jgi:opacity protein-like surface antigen